MIKAAIKLHQSGQLQQAKAHYRTILNTEPEHPDALHLYGLACHQLGDHETAIRYIRKAVELVPGQAVLRNNLGDALHQAGHNDEAVEQLMTALELRPGYAGAHQNLGRIYLHTGQHDQALEHCKLATELARNRPEAWFNLGLCYLDHVRLEQAADAFRQALTLRPSYQTAVTSLVYVLNLLPGLSPRSVSEETRRVAASAFDETPVVLTPIPTVRDNTARSVRIGYVSADFCRHAVNYFFAPVIEQHDKTEFDVYCYSDVSEPDDATANIRSFATHWRDLKGFSDKALMSQIQADEIDILVDLAGFTRHNRLSVFARQSAGLQLSWLGFPNTSGLQAMQFRLVDNITAPPDDLDEGTETLLRLPDGFACFRPPEHAPAVSEPPCVKNGFVTLGSLHKLEKLNPQLIELWAEVLHESPNARLLLARDQLDNWQQQRLQGSFEQHNIPTERLQMVDLSAHGQSFFELFADIDILLDVFPWSGHTLACCALWMGVPVVSLVGRSHAGRMVASVLHSLDLDQWVAADRHAYIQIIKNQCNNQSELAQIRSGLRQRFKQSVLRDEANFTRQLEIEYRRILNL